jgi:hypothetical protein
MLARAALIALPAVAGAHHQDSALEARVAALEARVAALEAGEPAPTPTSTPTPEPTPEPTPDPTPTPTPDPDAAFPGPDNTGDPTPNNNTAGAGITARTAGAVIQNVAVPWVDVQAPNVTIRDSVIGPNGLAVVSNSTGLVIEDTTLYSDNGGHGPAWSNYTARRVESRGFGNGFTAGQNVLIEDSWIHDLSTANGEHTDGVQFSSGAANVVIRRNTIDPTPASTGCTSAIITDPGSRDVLIDGNYLDGGGCSAALYLPRADAPNFRVTGNRMLRGVFTYVDYEPETRVTEFSGNVDANTGAAVTVPSWVIKAPEPTPTPTPTATPTPTPTATPTPTPTPEPDPEPAEWPNAANTGVPLGTMLAPSGSITTSSDGQVIEGRDISGTVTVNHANVTIRNSRIRSDALQNVRGNSTGLVVEYSDILDLPGGLKCHNGFNGSGMTIRFNDISGCENALNDGRDNTFERNYVHDLDTTGPSHVWGNDPHTDGIQDVDLNSRIVGNWIDPVPDGQGCTSPIITNVNHAQQQNVLVEDNYLDGRGCSWSVYGPRNPSVNTVLRDNRMVPGVNGAHIGCGRNFTTVAGNVDHATSQPATVNNTGGCTW